MIRVLGIPSTLRVGSNSRGLLRFAQQLAPTVNMEIQIADLSKIPLYNQDLDNAKDFPAAAHLFRKQILEADALLFSVSEYNSSVSGVLKNAIDWASRSTVSPHPFSGKQAAMMGQACILIRPLKFQFPWDRIFVGLDVHFMNKPEFFCQQFFPDQIKFDANGDLTHQPTQKFLEQFLKDFAKYIHQ